MCHNTIVYYQSYQFKKMSANINKISLLLFLYRVSEFAENLTQVVIVAVGIAYEVGALQLEGVGFEVEEVLLNVNGHDFGDEHVV